MARSGTSLTAESWADSILSAALRCRSGPQANERREREAQGEEQDAEVVEEQEGKGPGLGGIGRHVADVARLARPPRFETDLRQLGGPLQGQGARPTAGGGGGGARERELSAISRRTPCATEPFRP